MHCRVAQQQVHQRTDDSHIASTGKVKVWIEADSVIAFDDFA